MEDSLTWFSSHVDSHAFSFFWNSYSCFMKGSWFCYWVNFLLKWCKVLIALSISSWSFAFKYIYLFIKPKQIRTYSEILHTQSEFFNSTFGSSLSVVKYHPLKWHYSYRCSFYLHPCEGSTVQILTQGKLSAPRILRIHKVSIPNRKKVGLNCIFSLISQIRQSL